MTLAEAYAKRVVTLKQMQLCAAIGQHYTPEEREVKLAPMRVAYQQADAKYREIANRQS